MLCTFTTLLTLALAAQAAAPQPPQAKAKTTTKKAEPEVKYRYLPGPLLKPGSTLYIYWDNGPKVPITTDLFALIDLQKAIFADDQKGIDELHDSGRQLHVPIGTAAKVLQYDKGVLTEVPAYEVRILEGPYKDRKGWVVVSWVRQRVAVSAKPKRR